MAFLELNPIPSKIIINNTLIERFNSFNYLGYKSSCAAEENWQSEISKFVKIAGVGLINNILNPHKFSDIGYMVGNVRKHCSTSVDLWQRGMDNNQKNWQEKTNVCLNEVWEELRDAQCSNTEKIKIY